MRFPSLILAGAIAISTLCLAPTAQAADESPVIVAGKEGPKLDRAVLRSTSGGFWGAVLVAREGEILLAKGYGYADYRERPNTPRTLFEIASTSKQFTAAGVLRLQMQGKLNIDDSIGDYFAALPEDKRSITVHQLLTHTSGISPTVGLPYASPATRDQLIAFVMSQPLASKPGETFAYCNVGYALLAAIIEIASGQTFESYMKEEVFAPAGLEDTGFIGDTELDAWRVTTRLSDPLAPGAKDSTALNWHWSWGYRGMGGVVTTVHDLEVWNRALQGDDVLDASAKETLYTPVLKDYACGWQVGTTDRGTRVVSHSGSVKGFGCQFVRYLDEDVMIAILSNERSDVLAVQRALDETLFPKPMATLTLDVTRFDLDEHMAVQLSSPGWITQRDAGMVELKLVHPDDGAAVATINVTSGVAARLAADLDGMLAGRVDEGEDEPAMDVGVYLGGFGGTNLALTLTGIDLTLMPRYIGVDGNGEQVVDERITFVVVDRDRYNWPVLTKMNVRASTQLLKALRSAAEDPS
jgi:CubicO group peptidase (beta-lactamase class C family)